MSQQIPTPADNQQTPPEERFWKRYSPHHEFPLSSVGSVVLHILSLGALVVIGYVITRTRPDENSEPPTMSVVALDQKYTPAGSGGRPAGSAKSPGGIQDRDGKDIEKRDQVPDPSSGNDPTRDAVPLKDVAIRPITIEKSENGDRRILDENNQVLADLNAVLAQARKELDRNLARAAKGQAGPGQGGRKDKGKDKGIGSTRGDGVERGPRATIRQERQNRWKMFFATTGGADYLQQLQGLGAYLGVPQLKGDNQIEYLLIRDIRPNAVAKREDVSTLNRIFWFDQETRSVQGMAQALGLRHAPPFFVAFFPETLEKRLRELEQQAFSGDESRIVETHFRVVNRGGVYEVELDPVNPIVLRR